MRQLSVADLDLISSFRGYGRVGCFKGFDAPSFAFNTAAAPELFDRQFELLGRLIAFGLDVYGYVTLTPPARAGILTGIPRFLDRLQSVAPNLPLRVIPLEVQVFTPVRPRLDPARRESLSLQFEAVTLWQRELDRRFSASDRAQQVVDVKLQA